MTVRITAHRQPAGEVLMIDGRLDAAGVEELDRVMAGLAGTVYLDLTGLRSVDKAGLEVLRAVRDRGVMLVGTSRYLRLLLGARTRRRRARVTDK